MRLFKIIEERQILSDFFKPMLEARVNQRDWLENGLVLLLLRNSQANLDMIEDSLQKCKISAPETYTVLSNSIRGNDPGFDKKLSDLLAELRGVSWLIENGYSQIRKLPETSAKTPDFEAYKKTLCLFEVKNFRTPDTLMDLIFDKLEVQALLFPELYKALFHLDIRFEEQYGERLAGRPRLAVGSLNATTNAGLSTIDDAFPSFIESHASTS